MKRITAVSIGLALLASCGKDEARRAAPAPVAPVTVQTVTAADLEWPSGFEATGTIRARTSASLSSKVMGYVQQISVRVGDHVRAGQTLVTLEVQDLDSAVRTAEVSRAEVQSAVPEAESGIAAAQASLNLARATFRRMEDLFAKKSISNQEFDEATARLKAAEAGLEMSRARRAQIDSRMAQAEQGIRSASVMRDYSKLTAPFAGVITSRSAEPGTLATPGVPLLTLEQEGSLRLEATLDESRLGLVKVGQPVEVAIEALDRKLAARVSEIEPLVDAASRSYVAKIDLPALHQLRSGLFGRVVFGIGSRKVLTIPAGALQDRGHLQTVFVIEDGAAHTRLVTTRLVTTRLVTTGERGSAGVEILSGLSAGEKVASPASPALRDGARVEVRP
ncbi:MAG: efflux RND transporter periplasmic adaptor subunit [Acidobacteriia bacterium]|nr:efflux RND transporter periplasmic adaptor subunit [Terriglobia bacterium]